MYDKLTQSDIDKMMEEIEHRKLVVRRECLCIFRTNFNNMTE